MSRVEIARRVLDAIVSHARAEAPNECCGLLLGAAGRIHEGVAATNTLASPSRFRVDPREHFDVLKRTRGTGVGIVGAYHSHPRTAATPSRRDIDEAYDPELLYVIVSLADPDRPDVRAYRIREGGVAEVRLEAYADGERLG